MARKPKKYFARCPKCKRTASASTNDKRGCPECKIDMEIFCRIHDTIPVTKDRCLECVKEKKLEKLQQKSETGKEENHREEIKVTKIDDISPISTVGLPLAFPEKSRKQEEHFSLLPREKPESPLESPKEQAKKDLKNSQNNISQKETISEKKAKMNSNEKEEKSQVEALEKQIQLICECIKKENKSKAIAMVKEYGEKVTQTIKDLEEQLKNLKLTQSKKNLDG